MARSEIGEINVFRRFSSDRTDRVTEFYGYVLGLTALPSSALGGGQMIRYPVGDSEVKLFPSPPNSMNTAPLGDVIGVRLLTFFYDDEEALVTRFRSRGFAAPVFEGPGARRALGARAGSGRRMGRARCRARRAGRGPQEIRDWRRRRGC
jgi:hypothetical protein